MEKGRIACMAWSVTLLALICGLAPAAEAAIPANNVHAWGASGTTLNTVIYGTPVRGASPVSTTAPGGGGTLNSYLSGTTPISKLSVLKAFDGGTPISMSESPRSTTVWAAVENATTGAHELWYWNSTNPNPVKNAWTPAAGEEILKIVSSVEGSSSGYGAHAMLTTTGSSTNVYTWGSNTSGRTGQGTTSGSTTNPTAVAALSGTTIVDIAAGFNFMLAADSTGAIWGWGNNANGQLARSDIIGAIATPGKLIDSNTVGGTAPSGVVQVVAAGYAVDMRAVRLAAPFRRIGSYTCTIQFEKELKAEVQKRESVERRLAEEVKAQVPLKAQLSQLANVQAEAARFQLAAQKASAELPPLLEATKRLEQQVQQAEVISSVLREDKGALEKEVSVASLKLDAKTREVEKLANELRIERNKMLEIQVVQVQAETKKESKLGGLLERLLMAEKEREAIEKRALAAEREVKQVKQEVQAALIAMDCH